MVYQGFKVLKRNPTVYNPRMFAMIFLGYIGFGVFKFYINQRQTNFENIYEHHTHNYTEECRAYSEKSNKKLREWVLDQRRILDQKLRDEAKLA